MFAFFITACHKFCANRKIERPNIFFWREAFCCPLASTTSLGNLVVAGDVRDMRDMTEDLLLKRRLLSCSWATLPWQVGSDGFGWVLCCWEQCLLGLFVPLCLHLYLLDWQNVMLDVLKCQWWQYARDIYATFCEFFCLVHRLPIIISSSATNGSAPKSVK